MKAIKTRSALESATNDFMSLSEYENAVEELDMLEQRLEEVYGNESYTVEQNIKLEEQLAAERAAHDDCNQKLTAEILERDERIAELERENANNYWRNRAMDIATERDKLQALLEARPHQGKISSCSTEYQNWNAAVDAAGVPRK